MPWRNLPDISAGMKDPYKILVSELMLQQTQVDRVIPKYESFIQKFPTFKKLSHATIPEVLQAWQGLGYNRRALYLKQTAEIVDKKYHGELPHDMDLLCEFPGIGSNTAAAISAYSFNIPIPFIETNIRRIFIHFFFSKKKNIHDNEILELVVKSLDRKNPRLWYSALMDYGTYLKGQVENPNKKSKHYAKQSQFKGSDREIRGEILRMLLKSNLLIKKEIIVHTKETPKRIEKVLGTLVKDHFVNIEKGKVVLVK